jgi:hypothetical protein
MSRVAIPNWNAQGVLPPIDSENTTLGERSPYAVSLADIVLRYGTSKERLKILKGFLDFRAELHTTGLAQGFQWVDGSFLENIEVIENRIPRDMDIVTFYHVPAGQTQEKLANLAPRLFNPVCTKQDYAVDAYFVTLNDGPPEPLIGLSAYWYSLWSHRRNGQWKGYLQIDLSSGEDQVANANLAKAQGD